MNLNEMMRQAARLQRKVEERKKELANVEVTATALQDRVKATVTYGGRVTRIEIDPELIASEGLETALDGACVAVTQGYDEANKALEAELGKLTGAGRIPGMPFKP